MNVRLTPLQRHALAALAVLVACKGGTPVRAETTATFDLAARIEPGCLVDGLGTDGDAGHMGTLDFGSDSSLSTATHTASVLATQAIRLRCTPGVALLMAVDGGAHALSGVRHLQRGSDAAARIAYNVCRDAACAQPITIGSTTGIAVMASNSEDISLPLHASLTLPGTLSAGTYSDTLTVTLSW
ncbi:MAG: spore coat protein U domain-containing protein [Sphingopyxis sp.]|nr:spore coat protein U domain-containing protein [Sphingopyxis sp.]